MKMWRTGKYMLKPYLNDPFASRWLSSGNSSSALFEHAFSLEGQVFRNVKNRKTLRFFLEGKPYFVKLHRGVGWREIFKNLFQLKKPVLGAANEYLAIRKFEALGLDTMKIAAFAERGLNPASRESFLVTEELCNMTSLEDFCYGWKDNPPPSGLKHRLISELARICSVMHGAGVNHRDCYICHFLLDRSSFEKGELRLFVLDLHRAEIRRRIPRRMQVKDLAGIFFSSMDLGLGKRDALRFIAAYSRGGAPVDKSLWRDVLNTAVKLYRKEFSRSPELPPAQ